MKILQVVWAPVCLISILLTSCSAMYKKPDLDAIHTGTQMLRVSVHDPSIFAEGEGDQRRYYIFGSHMDSAVSPDLVHWESFSSGVSRYNRLFDDVMTDLKAFEYVGRNTDGGYSVWAPDVIYNPEMGKYMMYISTTSSYIKSSIVLTLSDALEGPYSYADTILYSGFTRQSVDQTNVPAIVGEDNYQKYLQFNNYNNLMWPNAIDPNIFTDAEGNLWLCYGSWSGGIFILKVDPQTGLPIHPENVEATGTDRYFGKHLAGGGHNSVEGPYIIYDPISGYYYLFVSYGTLTSNGGYQIRLFRSEHPDGPFTDSSGRELDNMAISHAAYGLKLMGNYRFPSQSSAYMAPGHNSALVEDDEIFLVYHVRFDDGSEYHEPRVHRLYRTLDGWLSPSPFSYLPDEQLASGEKKSDIAGYFYVINHGTDISSDIREGQLFLFGANGSIRSEDGQKTGSWNYDQDSADVSLTMGEDEFNGVLIRQNDEAGNAVLSISAVSQTNQTIWAVKYLE